MPQAPLLLNSVSLDHRRNMTSSNQQAPSLQSFRREDQADQLETQASPAAVGSSARRREQSGSSSRWDPSKLPGGDPGPEDSRGDQEQWGKSEYALPQDGGVYL